MVRTFLYSDFPEIDYRAVLDISGTRTATNSPQKAQTPHRETLPSETIPQLLDSAPQVHPRSYHSKQSPGTSRSNSSVLVATALQISKPARVTHAGTVHEHNLLDSITKTRLMPGRTQADTRWNAAFNGGSGGWRGQEQKRSTGEGRAGWRDQRTGNADGWRNRVRQSEQQAEGGWGASGSGNGSRWANSGNAWDMNYNDTASAWVDTPMYRVEDGWDVSESKVETMEDLLGRLAVHSEDFKKDLIPFFLKSVAAAEKEEPEVKLESFLEDKVQARKASGWYWTGSDSGNKPGDGWSDHKASDNGWGDNDNHGWGEQSGWGVKNDTPNDDGWGNAQGTTPTPATNSPKPNQWHNSRRPHNRRRGHG